MSCLNPCTFICLFSFGIIGIDAMIAVIFMLFPFKVQCWPLITTCKNINGTIIVDIIRENSMTGVFLNIFFFILIIEASILVLILLCGSGNICYSIKKRLCLSKEQIRTEAPSTRQPNIAEDVERGQVVQNIFLTPLTMKIIEGLS
jgi:hypothetical protein